MSFYVISNRGLEFVLSFFHSLGTTLDMQLYFTLDYYSKDDEQILEQYFHIL